MNYYTAVMILMLMTLFILCILVWENGRIRSENKRIYYLTYFLIGLSALAEKTGLQLSGNKDFPVWLLIIVKVADYILTPMAGAALWAQIGVKGRSNKIMFGGAVIQYDLSDHFQFLRLDILYRRKRFLQTRSILLYIHLRLCGRHNTDFFPLHQLRKVFP